MNPKIGERRGREARSVPERDLLGSGVVRENRSISAEAQATAPRASRSANVLGT